MPSSGHGRYAPGAKPAVLRVVGPPGSGKTLLIVSLTEALRSRGHRVASVVRREGGATVVTLSNGGRVTIERTLALEELRRVVPSLDPSVDLVLAEAFEDAGTPAIELRTPDGAALVSARDDLLAVVSSEEIAGAFARSGPGETNGLAELVEQRLLGRTVLGVTYAKPPTPPSRVRGGVEGFIARVLRRGG